ncbi:MAG: TldD/PmbA family protein [Candidatus Diapherotrites archaeon]|nr:TldD/PmbA family protein [Candidatus Diapherotrites archaeon]
MSPTIRSLDAYPDRLAQAVNRLAAENPQLSYADVRMELFEGRGVSVKDGVARRASEDWGASLGVRCYYGDQFMRASGMAGISLGETQLNDFSNVLNSLLETAYRRAKQSFTQKNLLRKGFNGLAKSIHALDMGKIAAHSDTVHYPFKKNPLDWGLDEMLSRMQGVSKDALKMEGIISSLNGCMSGFLRKLFVSTEGTVIDQTFPLTEAFLYVAAKGKETEVFHETLGGWGGPEVMDGVNPFEMSLEAFNEFLSHGTVSLANAPAAPLVKGATVITDPWFNSLLCHEIVGHPCEADRALKREAAWAGRAWWFNSMENNRIGKPVASEHVTAFSDPSLPGYGHYKYDDEGTPGKKVVHIDKGLLKSFLNSRETALILGEEPNGGMRADSAQSVPVIRMNNTCFAPGKWNSDELISETRDGFFVMGAKTPSIGETRQNFKITCWKLYRIENGELAQLYRLGGITEDSFNYLSSIDACAKDFKMFNIPNCGKGTPMQTMRVGNGGPTMRGKATVCGSHEVALA